METDNDILNVLIAEDDPHYCKILEKMLVNISKKYEVLSAGTLEEIFQLLDKRTFDVLLLDLNLRDAKGITTLERVLKKFPHQAIVVSTGMEEDNLGITAVSYGAQDFLIKGEYDFYMLDKSLHYAVERKKINDKLIETKNACESQAWGLQKTNEAIKILYKELEKKNEELKYLDKMKSEFVSSVSHELRTPLTAIKEGIALVLDGAAGHINDDQKEFLEIAKRNVDRLHRLINDVLDFEKLESGRMEFRMKEDEINQVVKETVETYLRTAQGKGLYIKKELDENVGKVNFDADRLTQVMDNLLNNAIKFTDKGGITVKTFKNSKDKVLIISVADTGEGIKDEDKPKLFQRFQQLGGVKNRKTGGTGLGLAICKQIIEKHGGKIWVESQSNKGAEFKFTLPIK